MSKLEEVKKVLKRAAMYNNDQSDGELLDELYSLLGINVDVNIDEIQEIVKSDYIKPKRIRYTEEGVAKTWDVISAHDSVSVIVYNITTEKYIFVKMFRPAVWNAGGDGYVLDLCAGLVDKDADLVQIAKEEVLEELGYDVPINRIKYVMEARISVGLIGSTNTMYTTYVCNTNKLTEGGGIGDENIEIVEYSLEELEEIVKTQDVTMGVHYLLASRKGK